MAEVAEAITRFSSSYIETYKPPPRVRGILALIGRCRTAALGARMYRCENCGYELPVYNSCGDRHCPRCLGARRARWVEQREQELLPLPYFHTVFTLPHELHGLMRANRRELYDLLFAAASETLRKFGADPRHALEGQLGFVTVLHTWDRKLGYHPHLHVLIAAGFGSLLDRLHEKNWVVYTKAPFGGPRQLVRYLARYIHRVGICDQRILEVSDSAVCFSYRERDEEQTLRTMTLEGVEFLRRFAQHILPKGFTRIRFYGFWSNSLKGKHLPLIRKLLGSEPCPESGEQRPTDCVMEFEAYEHICPKCGGGPLLPDQRLLPSTGPPLPS